MRCRIGNVVEFEIEKYLAARSDLPYDRRAVGDEGLKSYLEHSDRVAQGVGQCQDLVALRAIQCDDEAIPRLHGIMIGQSGAGFLQ